MELFLGDRKILPDDEISRDIAENIPTIELTTPNATAIYGIILYNTSTYYLHWVSLNDENLIPYDAPDAIGNYTFSVYENPTDFSVTTLFKSRIQSMNPLQSLNFKIVEYPKIPYKIIKLLGKGGFGKVYQIVKDGKDYALKQYINMDSADIITEIDFINRCHHPNIIGVNEVLQNIDGGCDQYFIMELSDGGTLNTYLESRNVSESDKERIIQGLLCGVAYLHKNNIIHRDLKPGNILMVEGMPKIGDFGAAVNIINSLQLATFNSTTIYWSPPEFIILSLLKKSETYYNEKVDIWSLGCIIYEIIAGKRLIDGSNDEDCLYQIIRRIGLIPSSWIKLIKPKLKVDTTLGYNLETGSRTIIDFISGYETSISHDKYFGEFPEKWKPLVLKMLKIDPNNRPSAQECLSMMNGKQCSIPEISISPSQFNSEYLKIRNNLLSLLVNLQTDDIYESNTLSSPDTFILAINIIDRFFNSVELARVKRPRKITEACLVIAHALLYSHNTNISIPKKYAKEICEVMSILHYQLYEKAIGLDLPDHNIVKFYTYYLSHYLPSELQEYRDKLNASS